MELRQLELFVAVAEERNFHRAAERCRIAQPALSRRIQALERSVGVRLLHRTTRAVEITPAGSALLAAAREALATLGRGAATARRLDAGAERLVLAFPDYATHPFVPRLLRRFGERHPNVPVEWRELSPAEQLGAVRAREVDVGFVGVPGTAAAGVADGGGGGGGAPLAFLPMSDLRWTVALPSDHPLAVGDVAGDVPLAGYAGAPLVLFPRRLSPGLYDRMVACIRAAGGGAAPRIVEEPAQLHSALALVAAGMGVMPSPFHVADQAHAGVTVRGTSGFDAGARICAVHRRDDPSPALAAFLAVAGEVIVRDTALELVVAPAPVVRPSTAGGVRWPTSHAAAPDVWP